MDCSAKIMLCGNRFKCGSKHKNSWKTKNNTNRQTQVGINPRKITLFTFFVNSSFSLESQQRIRLLFAFVRLLSQLIQHILGALRL